MPIRHGLFHVGAFGPPARACELILIAVVAILHHVVDAHAAVSVIIIVALPKGAEAIDGDHPVIAEIPAQRLHLAAIKFATKHHALLIRFAIGGYRIAGKVGHSITVLVLELLACVAKVEIQPPIRTKHKLVNPMIVLRTADARKKRLFFVGLIVSVHVGKHLHLVQRADNDPRIFTVGRTKHTHAVG